MINYKSVRIVDGKPRWVIVDEIGTIVKRNPNKEELKGLERWTDIPYTKGNKKIYNETNTCDICRELGKIERLISHNACHELDEKGDWTGRWICQSCHCKYIRKNDPYCTDNLKKSLSDRRTKNQNPSHQNYIGDLFEKITCTWRHIDNMNIVNDNYEYPIDHSRDPELGILQTKGRSYDPLRRYWTQSLLSLHDGRGSEFDNLIFYCANENRNIIERIYIIPKDEVIKRTNISIYKNNVNGWYEKYRVTDEKILELVNKIYKEIIRG